MTDASYLAPHLSLGLRVKRNFLFLAVTLLLTAYQLVRMIAFVEVYGGIEHDGGWALTVSRELAERGTYTTTVNTIVDPTVPGGMNIDKKFDVQTPDGRIWFRSGNPIGPASIIPAALLIKIFGHGFWALRAGPLIFYALFLLSAAYLLYQLAGLGSVILFHLFLFGYPHLSIFLGYEALGEMPGMVYVLAAYLVFAAATQKQERRGRAFFITGLLAGLAIQAKLVTLWSLSGIFGWAGILWLIGWVKRWRGEQAQEREAGEEIRTGHLSFGELLWLGGGTLLVQMLWEIVQFIGVNRLVTFDMYLRHVQQRIDDMLDAGSGVRERLYAGPEFFWDKFFLLSEVAHPQRWVTAIIFGAILLGGLSLVWLWRGQPARQNLFIPLWLGWLVNTIWFVSLAKTGWPRHFWFGLVAAVLLLSVIPVAWLRGGGEEAKRRRGEEAKKRRGEEAKRRGDEEVEKGGGEEVKKGGGEEAKTRRGEEVEKGGDEEMKKRGSEAVEGSKASPLRFIASSLHRFIASSLHRFIASSLHRLLTSSLPRLLASSPHLAGLLLLVLIGWGLVSQPYVWGFFLPDELVPYWQAKRLGYKYGATLPWIIIPRAAQAEIINYINQLPVETNVYYPAQHKAAEMAAQVNRIFYPLNRRQLMMPHAQDVAIIGPSLIAPWIEPVRRQALLDLVQKDCPSPLIANDYYMLCPFPPE